jgi:hypothetical protein
MAVASHPVAEGLVKITEAARGAAELLYVSMTMD